MINLTQKLVESNLISDKDMETLLAAAKDTRQSLFELILSKKLVNERELLSAIAQWMEFSFEDIDKTTVDKKIARLVPEEFARNRGVLPLFQFGTMLTVALSNPFHFYVLEELEQMTGFEINAVLTPKDSLESLFNYCYAQTESSPTQPGNIDALMEMGMKLVGDLGSGDEAISELVQEAPIAKLVDTIIRQAIDLKASDIHIEPEEKIVRVRLRIDGMLRDILLPPKKLESAIVSRIKILANMDITERRKPQDGRLSIKFKDRNVDFRVSTVATIYGEKMVLRILDKAGAFFDVDHLGLRPNDQKTFMHLITSAAGVVIVCGPTGSGKTSTLYSALAHINTPEKNIITIEDPVEYSIEGINQIPVNAKIGVDFAKGLSTIVRQDPDVIMVGEIRDYETAAIAVQAALTGHMVFTTLHTQSAPGALTRLVDMGVPPFLLSSAVSGVIGQRLVRRLCPNCKQEVPRMKPKGFKQDELLKEYEKIGGKSVKFFEGRGCVLCDNTGYKGRVVIFEVMVMNDTIRNLLNEKASMQALTEAALESGMTTMTHDGLQKAIAGFTTLHEVARVLDL